MSYQNFIPTVWAEAINRELEKSMVFAEDCNRQYEGEVKEMGDTIRILGVGKPTITTGTNKNVTLSAAETVEDTSITMPVRQLATFNYEVGDIDKRQAVGGLMEALNKESSEGCADEMDKYIASLGGSVDAIKYAASSVKVDTTNILAQIDLALQGLYEKNVKPNAKITLTCPPRFYFILKQAYQALDTDNSKILENGKVGKYGNVIVKMSNNVFTANGGVEDRIMIRTDKAVAFVNPMTHIEPYRPELKFSDAIKGFVLFDAKIVRPKELIVMNVKYA